MNKTLQQRGLKKSNTQIITEIFKQISRQALHTFNLESEALIIIWMTTPSALLSLAKPIFHILFFPHLKLLKYSKNMYIIVLSIY